MFGFLVLGAVLSSGVRGETNLGGIEFSDNFGQEYLTAENGIAVARTKVKEVE